MKFGKAVVKCRVLILIIAVALMVPSLFGMIFTRVNYDMLNYLPENLETVKGQEYLMEDFGKGAFSFLIVEDMDDKGRSRAGGQNQKVDHVDTVLWYSDVADLSVPMEVLPDKVYDAFNTDNATLMAIFFDTSTSADETMDAIARNQGRSQASSASCPVCPQWLRICATLPKVRRESTSLLRLCLPLS